MLPQKLLRALQSVTIMPINRKQNETTVLLRLMIQELKSQINTTTNSKLLGATSVQRENPYLAKKKKAFSPYLKLGSHYQIFSFPQSLLYRCSEDTVKDSFSDIFTEPHRLTAVPKYSVISRLQIPRLMLPTVNGNSCLLQLLQHAIRPGC